jgi:hypothetical protein
MHDCVQTPVTVKLEKKGDFKSVKLTNLTTGAVVPCQWEEEGDVIHLSWIVDGMSAEAAHKYQAEFLDEDLKVDVPGVLLEKGEWKIEVKIGGELFTCYNFNPDIARPYFYPLIGPYGKRVTRGYPMEDIPGEKKDHPHHRSFYVAYGDVNGVDNWSEGKEHGWTVHRRFERIVSGPVYGRMVAVSDWMDHDKKVKVMEEIRDVRIYNVGPDRLLDMDVTFIATEGDVLFGDTKEGGIASIRVATSMDVPNGGKIENSFGGINEAETWGKRAQWCDYSGPVEDKILGIAILDHPESFRHPTWWHVRNYGLMTANPFGLSYFYNDPNRRGDHTLKAGEKLKFKYRLYIHRGDAAFGKVAEKYNNFVNPPKAVK